MSEISAQNILWWGRYCPGYSRNRILSQALEQNGYTVHSFRPKLSALANFEARVKRLNIKPEAVWVPAFRHSDVRSARAFADRHGVPLIFDPLISAWDKAVFERGKYADTAFRARRLLKWERTLFSSADLILADTELHAEFFIEHLQVPAGRVAVVPVGAEENLFTEQPDSAFRDVREVLFYGSFIHLQGPEVIAQAAKNVPEVKWTMVGEGPLRGACEKICAGCDHVRFEDWIPYDKLPARIGNASILLGIFGTSPKPGRVIPNKVYQSLACGRPTVTRVSGAYPRALAQAPESGMVFINPGDPDVLAYAVRGLMADPGKLQLMGRQARKSYETYFSEKCVHNSLSRALRKVNL